MKYRYYYDNTGELLYSTKAGAGQQPSMPIETAGYVESNDYIDMGKYQVVNNQLVAKNN